MASAKSTGQSQNSPIEVGKSQNDSPCYFYCNQSPFFQMAGWVQGSLRLGCFVWECRRPMALLGGESLVRERVGEGLTFRATLRLSDIILIQRFKQYKLTQATQSSLFADRITHPSNPPLRVAFPSLIGITRQSPSHPNSHLLQLQSSSKRLQDQFASNTLFRCCFCPINELHQNQRSQTFLHHFAEILHIFGSMGFIDLFDRNPPFQLLLHLSISSLLYRWVHHWKQLRVTPQHSIHLQKSRQLGIWHLIIESGVGLLTHPVIPCPDLVPELVKVQIDVILVDSGGINIIWFCVRSEPSGSIVGPVQMALHIEVASGDKRIVGEGVVVELVFVGVAVEVGLESLGILVGLPRPALVELDVALGRGLDALLVVLVVQLPLYLVEVLSGEVAGVLDLGLAEEPHLGGLPRLDDGVVAGGLGLVRQNAVFVPQQQVGPASRCFYLVLEQLTY